MDADTNSGTAPAEARDPDAAWIAGACHCGSVRFRARLSEGLRSARRCNCSLCRMRGAVAVSAGCDGVEVLVGAEALRAYRFNTGVAEHFFCGTCGIYTHHRRRSRPDQFGVNVACLAGMSPFDFAEVPVNEGRAHPSDAGQEPERPAGPRVAGVLRYVPNV